MPVTDQTTSNSSTGNGVTTVYPYTFKILDQNDLLVEVDGVAKTLTTHYTVSGVGNSGGGNVTFTSPPALDAVVVVSRSMAYSRDTDYQENGDLRAATLDEDVDRVTMLIQQVRQLIRRAVKLPSGVTADQVLGTGNTAAERASKMIGFDSNGDLTLFTVADLDPSLVTAFIATLFDDADAAAARVTLGAIGASDAVSFASSVALAADISPAQITANQNDYNPTGLSTASVLRLNTDASRDITGLQGGADGRLIVITNVGSFAMVLKDESASSTAANRFALTADITLATDQSVVLQYDSTSSRWRAVALPAGTAGAAGDVQTFNAGGTWTKPASGTMALIEVWGAGGGGARQSVGNSGGGAGGGYSLLWKKLSDLGATETVTIGAGGAAQNTDATSGNNGGTTSFGAHLVHVGGTGGDRAAAAATAVASMPGGIGAVQGTSSNAASRPGANSALAFLQTSFGAYPLGSAGIASTNSATDALVTSCNPAVMGGGNGGGASTVSATQGTGGTSVYGGAGGDGNKAGAGSAGTQPGGGGGAGTTQGGAGGDGRVKISVF